MLREMIHYLRPDVSIDESMTKNMCHAVTFIQYMPAKQIKQGTKGTITGVQLYLIIFINTNVVTIK